MALPTVREVVPSTPPYGAISLTGKAPAWKAGSNRETGVCVQVALAPPNPHMRAGEHVRVLKETKSLPTAGRKERQLRHKMIYRTLAQLGERLPYKQEVASSILVRPTKPSGVIGNTADSDSVVMGSNPMGAAKGYSIMAMQRTLTPLIWVRFPLSLPGAVSLTGKAPAC